MSLRAKFITTGFLLTMAAGLAVSGQEPLKTNAAATPTPAPTPAAISKDAIKNPTAEQIAETVIFLYGGGGGREKLNQIRKTAIERGRITVANADGKMEQARYQRWTTRGETIDKEKIRLDQEFPSASYSLVFNEEKIFGIFKDAVFTPREDASKAFQNQILYGVDTLLRYKESGSKLELVGREKMGGVDMHAIDVIDKENRKTRFYISAKSYRVMMLDYEDQGTKYRRKFYDYNIAQGTLVPYKSVLYAGDKVIEEIDIGTVTYGQKIDDGLYSAN